MRTYRTILLVAGFLGFKAIVFLALLLTMPHDTPEGLIFVTVPHGKTAGEIGESLAQQGLPINPATFSLVTLLTGTDKKLGSGVYSIGRSFSLLELLESLTSGGGLSVKISFPEGLTMNEVASRLSSELAVDEALVLSLSKNKSFADSLVRGEANLEGFLFPDTYRFPPNASGRLVLRTMATRFQEVFDESMRNAARRAGLTSREAVVLASIIEKEAKLPEERPIISAVFHNRLSVGRPLESCATVRFFLQKPIEPLTYADLETRSPYNTYLNAGLPPDPICSPGKASLEAAVYPASVDYLYFVAKGDGSHIFSRTLDEHNLAKQRMKNRIGS
jgi:UPF0755 protein